MLCSTPLSARDRSDSKPPRRNEKADLTGRRNCRPCRIKVAAAHVVGSPAAAWPRDCRGERTVIRSSRQPRRPFVNRSSLSIFVRGAAAVAVVAVLAAAFAGGGSAAGTTYAALGDSY